MSTIFTVKLPDIGEGVAEGEVIEWLKKPGDFVVQDEPVVVVMTDKATVELPAPHPGILAKQYFKEGEKAPVHQPLYDLQLDVATQQEPTKELPQKSETTKKVMVEKPKAISSTSKLALPQTRHLAREMGIDIEGIPASGLHGEVTESDLRKSLSQPTPTITRLPGDEERPIIGVRQLMAKHMTESLHHIPHFSYFEQADAVRLIQLRENVKKAAASEGINATYMPFFIRALSLTIAKFPEINSSLDKNKLILHKQQNIGIAITTQYGLIVPCLKNVQDMKLQQIIRSYDELKKKALSNSLGSSDMKDATITISNYGVLGGGGRWATPIINFPEVAILAVARIQKQPVVKNDKLEVREVLNLSWSFDHRVIDGEMAAEASHFFGTLIANPAPLL